jgi:Zn-dependent protease with chaperone function
MHWVLILAVLLATTLAEQAPAAAADHAAARAIFALGAMLIAPALAATMSALVIRGLHRDAKNWPAWLSRFAVVQQLHAGLLVALVGAISYGLAWPQIVRVNLGLGPWILIDDLLILAPVYVPLMLSWAMFYDVDRAVHELTATEDDPAQACGRWRYVLLHARHYLGLVLLPLLAVMMLYDVVKRVSPGALEDGYAWLEIAPLLAAFIVFLPKLLALLWKTEPLPPGELRDELTHVLDDCALHVREILVWHTDGRMMNAAVSGFFPRLRYVFLTDRLLERMSASEVAAVLRHEAGHIVKRHLPLRMLLLGLPIAIYLALNQAAPQTKEQLSALLSSGGMTVYAQQCVLLPGAVALYALVVLGAYCKLLEYEADVYACGLGRVHERKEMDLTMDAVSSGPFRSAHAPYTEQTQTFLIALAKIAAETGGRHRDGWLHPSLTKRTRFIRQAARQPLLARRLMRFTAGIAWLLAVSYAVCLAIVIIFL